MLTHLFWILFGLIAYTYLGYTLIILLISLFVRKYDNPSIADSDLPSISFIIAAYNEMAILPKKIENCLQINYPRSKIQFIIITDGSTDGSEKLAERYDQIRFYIKQQGRGKWLLLTGR
jgi:biofilm PGA synthesis N-glycosyltransferase PgaC